MSTSTAQASFKHTISNSTSGMEYNNTNDNLLLNSLSALSGGWSADGNPSGAAKAASSAAKPASSAAKAASSAAKPASSAAKAATGAAEASKVKSGRNSGPGAESGADASPASKLNLRKELSAGHRHRHSSSGLQVCRLIEQSNCCMFQGLLRDMSNPIQKI